VRRALTFVPVETMDQVLEHALERVPGREPAAPSDTTGEERARYAN